MTGPSAAEALPGVDDAVFEQLMADDAAEEIACLRWLRDRFDLSDSDARIWLGAAMAWEIA
ncbi:MAG: hypothetical protein ACRDSN_21095 [Pseudonocardiaceae bacterium]